MPKAAMAKSKTIEAAGELPQGYCAVSKIQLLVPLLYNKHPEERGDGGAQPEEAYEKAGWLKVHSKEGSLILPAWNIKVALVKGFQKAGYKAKDTDLVKAFVFPEDAIWGFSKPDRLNVAWGRIPPRTGPYQKIYRPEIDKGKEIIVRFNVVNPRVNFAKLRRGWEETGYIVGMGAWRPEYGRFRVMSFEKENS